MILESATSKEFLTACVKIVQQCDRNPVNGYVSLEHFVLKNGKQWPIGERPPRLRMGPVKQCYCTATNYALRWPDRYIYCEGYARGIMPLMHAWLLDTEGHVIETTWREMGVDYFGVAVRHDFLSARMCEQEVYGLIDQPGDKWPMLRADPKTWRHPIMDL